MRPYSVNRGFTLIELMIVVSIMSILAAIALPMYNEHVLSAKLAEAPTNLADIRTRAEHYFSDNRTYVGFPANCGVPASNAKYFTYTCDNPAPTATTYTATATARKATLGWLGAVYTINQSNVRATTYSDDFTAKGWSNATCWQTKKRQTC